jgi:BirA family biotin operon repressor/biotin-[acetyl-CoA-carboxylase] ligase
MLLRPEEVPVSRFGWLPLLAGVALAETVRRVTELDATLKWPNDLLLPGDRKCAGILAEAVGSQAAGSQAVVLGVGLNVSLKEHELPRPDATSLKLAGAAAADRGTLLKQLLRSVEQWYGRWRAAGGAGIRADYLAHCGTIGRVVKVGLPDGTTLEGLAVDVDDDGRLVVEAGGELRPVAAGDVVHVR